MRSSEFLPPGDNGDWLVELLTGLEEPVFSEIDRLQPIIEGNQVDFDSLSPRVTSIHLKL